MWYLKEVEGLIIEIYSQDGNFSMCQPFQVGISEAVCGSAMVGHIQYMSTMAESVWDILLC